MIRSSALKLLIHGFEAVEGEKSFDVFVNVNGGGSTGTVLVDDICAVGFGAFVVGQRV